MIVLKWETVPKEQQDRIVTMLGQMIQRRMEADRVREADTDDSSTSGSGIDRLSQEWENTEQALRPTCSGIHSAIINTASRAAPGVNKTPVRVRKSGNRIGLAEAACADN